MSFKYEDIRIVTIEGDPACNANCPMCIRYDSNDKPTPALLGNRVSHTAICELLEQLSPQLDEVLFCGNYGDPCLTIGFIDMIRAIDDSVTINIETNGGMFRPEWWKNLAWLLKDRGSVAFNIDGLHDTLGIYRRGVDYRRVIKNAEAFIEEGGNARWCFIPFAHNEHQVEKARVLAERMGFSLFELRVTDRFQRNDGTVLTQWKRRKSVIKPSNMYGKKPIEDFENKMRTCSIECASQRDKSIYIDYRGNVFPCCITAPIDEAWSDDLGTTKIREFIDKLPPEHKPNIRANRLSSIVEGPFFRWLFDTFGDPDKRPRCCASVCGVGNFKEIK